MFDREVIWSADGCCGKIGFTFDDGPHPVHTLGVLDELDKLNSKATFFVIGQNVSRYKDVVREVSRRGHDIGIHTYSHLSMKSVSYDVYMQDVLRCDQELESLGIKTTLFRPPFGDVSWYRIFDLSKNRKIVFWNKDTMDYSFNDIASAWDYSRQLTLSAGDIILMHDVYAHTPELVRRLGVAAKGAGIEMQTISKMVG